MSSRRAFGKSRKLPSGRIQASYVGPDGIRYNAPSTFRAQIDADRWLFQRQDEIAAGTWNRPEVATKATAITFAAYAEKWLERTTMAPLTRKARRGLLKNYLLPTFGDRPLRAIRRSEVRDWFWALDRNRTPSVPRNTYILLHTIFEAAIDEELVDSNPVRVKGAAAYETAKQVEPATPEELAALIEEMPHKWRLLVALGAWCALRFGEITALTRADIDVTNGVVKVRRGVVHPGGPAHVGKTKTRAGVRDVSIPPHVMPLVLDHLNTYVTGRDGLLFPNTLGGYLQSTNFYGIKPYVDKSGKARPGSGYNRARYAIGRPDLNFHALRHTGATMAAQNGATVKELMARLGHSSEKVAMHYQHASAERDRALAKRMSEQLKRDSA